MSRRVVVLALVVLAGSAVGAANANPPGPQPAPGPQPVDPPPASLCASYPHPLLSCRVVAVSCPSSARAQFACKTVQAVGAADAPVQKLELQLPRRYASVKLTCRVDAKSQIACRVASRTVASATGVRVVVIRLPETFATVRIACATTRAKFACSLQN